MTYNVFGGTWDVKPYSTTDPFHYILGHVEKNFTPTLLKLCGKRSIGKLGLVWDGVLSGHWFQNPIRYRAILLLYLEIFF